MAKSKKTGGNVMVMPMAPSLGGKGKPASRGAKASQKKRAERSAAIGKKMMNC